MIRLGELIERLQKWEKDMGPDCEVSIDWECLYNWKENSFYAYVSDVSIVGQNEIQIEFD